MTINPYMRYVRDYNKINLYKKKNNTYPRFGYYIIVLINAIIIIIYSILIFFKLGHQ